MFACCVFFLSFLVRCIVEQYATNNVCLFYFVFFFVFVWSMLEESQKKQKNENVFVFGSSFIRFLFAVLLDNTQQTTCVSFVLFFVVFLCDVWYKNHKKTQKRVCYCFFFLSLLVCCNVKQYATNNVCLFCFLFVLFFCVMYVKRIEKNKNKNEFVFVSSFLRFLFAVLLNNTKQTTFVCFVRFVLWACVIYVERIAKKQKKTCLFLFLLSFASCSLYC